GAERQRGNGEDEHGRQPARERIEHRQPRPAVGGAEQEDVDELERGAAGHVGPGPRLDAPAGGCDRGPGDHADAEGDGGRCLRRSRPGEEDVPERMQECRREGEREGFRRHYLVPIRSPSRRGAATATSGVTSPTSGAVPGSGGPSSGHEGTGPAMPIASPTWRSARSGTRWRTWARSASG